MENQESAWNQSYDKGDNFVFYPHEEVIRFFARHIRKRSGVNTFIDRVDFTPPPKILDLGCGIGRHVAFAHDMGAEAYGIDLSSVALDVARKLIQEQMPDAAERIVQGDIRELPWPDQFFDFVVSHGVLDSMHFDIARSAVQDLQRVMKPGGKFYCDLVSGDDSAHAREYAEEEVVSTAHEKNTVQSYFNFAKIQKLIDVLFTLEECALIRRADVINGASSARYHLVLTPVSD